MLRPHKGDASKMRGISLPPVRVTNHQSIFKTTKKSWHRLYIEVQRLRRETDGIARSGTPRRGNSAVRLVAQQTMCLFSGAKNICTIAALMNAIRLGWMLRRLSPPEITTGEAWFKPAQKMHKIFHDHTNALQELWKSDRAICSSSWENDLSDWPFGRRDGGFLLEKSKVRGEHKNAIVNNTRSAIRG